MTDGADDADEVLWGLLGQASVKSVRRTAANIWLRMPYGTYGTTGNKWSTEKREIAKVLSKWSLIAAESLPTRKAML